MKKSLIFVLLMMLLNACAPQTAPVPPTATLVPPTATPLPSPTPLPETWVSAGNGEGIVLPEELFDIVKEQNPVVSADGEQIINSETDEVLLEKKDGCAKML
ncbi:MAG: hypothetical protein L3J16_03145 [Anaerolineales bacterium]|nr:hypothetical protein [Anaerolineales bacterium]